MFPEAIFFALGKTLFKVTIISQKIYHCLSANDNPELPCVDCTGITVFAPVLHFRTGLTLKLHCSQPIRLAESSNFFMCILNCVILLAIREE